MPMWGYIMRQIFSVLMSALLVGGLLFAGMACMGVVQAASKPSVPQFSLKIVGDAYDVPPAATTTIDPYTGKAVTTFTNGYRHDDRKIEISIKNQPFTPSTDPNGQQALYYVVQYKGHFSDDEWENETGSGAILQSDSIYTVITHAYNVMKYSAGSQLDFRVKAIIGRGYYDGYYPNHLSWVHIAGDTTSTTLYFVDDVSSDWSSTQTVTIPAYTNEAPNQPNLTPDPTYTPDQPPQTDQPTQTELTVAGFSLVEFGLVITCVVIVVLSIALVYMYKHKTSTSVR